MVIFDDSTAADWDAAQSELHVHHEQPTGTDWAASDIVELGPPSHDEGGTSLEFYYPFDEDSGTTAYDVSPNARDGLIDGPTVGQPGIRGTTCYTFKPIDNDELETGWAGVGGSANRTFACWVKTATGADQSLANYGDQVTNGAKWVYRIDEASTVGNWVPRIEVAGGYLRGTTHIADGNWHHIACVLEGSDVTDHTLYVDGSVETVDSSAAQAVNTDTLAEPVSLGRRPTNWSGAGARTLDGEMDEPQFYSRALSAAEIQTLAHGDTPTGSLTSAVHTVADAAPPGELTTTSSLNGGSIDVTVFEDTNQDGTADHSQTVSLVGGVGETNSLSGFAGGTNVDYWVEIRESISTPTATAPTFDSYTVESSVTTATVSGTFTYDDIGTSGATVRGVNDTQGTHQGTATTDTNGNYSIDFPTGEEGHFMVEYEDPETGEPVKAESKPFLVPE